MYIIKVLTLCALCLAVTTTSDNLKDTNLKNNSTIDGRPNIVFILADDLDIVLGSPKVMKKTINILGNNGASFENAFTSSPICCPSRSSILTGRYAHNHQVNSNNRNCSGPEWIKGPEKQNFGKLMQDAGYATGYFGKYLNKYQGDYVPPGWNEWVGLVRNSRYYNYTLNVNGEMVRHNNNYKKDYFTNVITDRSLKFFQSEKARKPNTPVLAVVSMSAPHGPEDSAPQYTHSFKDTKAPRYPNYNYTSEDKHWIIRKTPPMDETRTNFTDMLHRKRLQTLLSLDDAVEKIYLTLAQSGQLENTYIMFSSDHGYHLGQFNQVKGKSQPYESDIRIPLYMRGPKIPKGLKIKDIAMNIDFAPTFLDIAKAKAPAFIDGTSLMDLAVGRVNAAKGKVQKPVWKDTFLVERGKLKSVPGSTAAAETALISRLIFPKERKAKLICENQGFPQPPCTAEKEIICYWKEDQLVLQRCATEEETVCPCNTRRPPPLASTTMLYVPASSGGIENFMAQLEREFQRLKRRIKRHGIEYLKKYSKKKQRPAAPVPSYARSSSEATQNENNKNVNVNNNKQAKRQRNVNKHERRRYWRMERKKLVKMNSMYRSLASKLVQQMKRSSNRESISRNNSCLCSKKTVLNQRKGRDMNCFHMDKQHWKTYPYWTGALFTACTNSPNSTYWCLRTINTTHNFLYCEFITGFKEYFDINKDPYQLKNIASSIALVRLQELHKQLIHLKECKGTKGCMMQAGQTITKPNDLQKKWLRYERKKQKGLFVLVGDRAG